MVLIVIERRVKFPLLRSIFTPGHLYKLMSFFLSLQKQIDVYVISFQTNMSSFLKQILGIEIDPQTFTMDDTLGQIIPFTQSQASYDQLEIMISDQKPISPFYSMSVLFSTIQFMDDSADISCFKNISPQDLDYLVNSCQQFTITDASIQIETSSFLDQLKQQGFKDTIGLADFIQTISEIGPLFSNMSDTFETLKCNMLLGQYMLSSDVSELKEQQNTILDKLTSIQQKYEYIFNKLMETST